MSRLGPRAGSPFSFWTDRDNYIGKIYEVLERKSSACFCNDYWDNYELNEFSKERIEYLENILKRPNIHPKQKK